MRNRSATWERIVETGEFRLETVAVINGVEYSTITAPVITNGLLPDKTLSVGNCIAGTLSFSVMTNNVIPKSAEIIIKGRVTDETTYSEWLEFGHFWIDKRMINEDLEENLIDIEAFDAMLKGNQPYVDNSQTMNWPKDMQTVVNRIAQQMGIQIDSRTTIKTGADYIVYKPDADMTLLDILSNIGAVHGGNWTITPENKLRLVPLVSAPPETFYVVDEFHRHITTPENDYLVSRHGESIVLPTGIGYINVPVVLGKITTANTYEISRVTMVINGEEKYTAGDDTGFKLTIEVPYATQAICDALAVDLYGLVYAPYDMTQACFDPANELGDMVNAGIVHSVIYTSEQTLDLTYRVDASAPGEDELESEYPYITTLQKTKYSVSMLRADNALIHTEISQTQQKIALKVSKDSIISAINLSEESITIEASKLNLTGYATFTSLSTAGETTINGANISTGYMSADRIQGGTLILGGYNNANGILQIKNASNTTIGEWSKNGVVINYGNINLDTGSSLSIRGIGNDDNQGCFIDNSGFLIRLVGNSVVYTNAITFSSANNDNYAPSACTVGDLSFEYQKNTHRYRTYIGPNYLYCWSDDTSVNGDCHLFYNGEYFEVKDGYNNSQKYFTIRFGDYNDLVYNGTAIVYGNFWCYSTKSRIVATDQYSDRLLYCYETPSPLFGDVGEGLIADDGLCYVVLDAIFAQTISTDQYQVVLQKYGDGDCWIKERRGAYFVVQGTPGLRFGWEVKAKQRDFDQLRLERKDEPFYPPEQTYGQDAAEYIKELEDGRIPA